MPRVAGQLPAAPAYLGGPRCKPLREVSEGVESDAWGVDMCLELGATHELLSVTHGAIRRLMLGTPNPGVLTDYLLPCLCIYVPEPPAVEVVVVPLPAAAPVVIGGASGVADVPALAPSTGGSFSRSHATCSGVKGGVAMLVLVFWLLNK